MEILENISLKSYNTFGIDVKANYFAELTDLDQIDDLLNNDLFITNKKLFLGSGSNILFTQDFQGIVVKIGMHGVELCYEDDEYVEIYAAAGELWADFVMLCLENEWYGVENLAYIPGTVGAAPVQNIGAYGVEAKEIIKKVHCVDLVTGQETVFEKDRCKFGYRESIFKNECKGKYLIVGVTFLLHKKPTANLNYHSIVKGLTGVFGKHPTPLQIAEYITKIRKEKLPEPTIIGNGGSFFKNPIVSDQQFCILKEQFPDIVSYPQETGVKLAAAWLIEKAGFKGCRMGDAGVHDKQALVLINHKNATGNEILNLAQKIIEAIENQFNVTIVPEINII